MTKNFPEILDRALEGVRICSSAEPKIGLILGSGLSGLASSFGGTAISYAEIPGFPAPGVAGHAGTMHIGNDIVVFAGRYHFYEGHDMDTLLLPLGLMYRLGVKTVIITNAAGSLNAQNGPGSLVLIRDHLNMMGINPLRGPHISGYGPRFPDMSEVYSPRLRALAKQIDTALAEGIYCAVTGPCYETPAEIQAYQRLGADLVGMSTVPEAIFSRSIGMETLGISLVTNLAAGMGAQLDHAEVMEEGKKASERLGALITKIVEVLTSNT
jgi:purine-nucleoside phosphorylase